MYDVFELPVTYKGQELQFPAQLLPSGYTHRFQVNVFGQDVLFEPDEERTYRALVDPEKPNKQISVDLLQAIAESISEILR